MTSHAKLLTGLFPANVATVFSDALPANAELLGPELTHAQKMAQKRYNEFIHGRWCARQAMQLAGVAPVAIDKGPNREPVWPEKVAGSISHTKQFAGAVIASTDDYTGIGLDMESAAPLEEKLFKAICLPEETALFGETPGQQAKLLFSAKEAIYKCLWPSVQRYIDFLEMQVHIDHEDHTFSATPHTDKCSPELVAAMQGRFVVTDQLVMASAWIQA